MARQLGAGFLALLLAAPVPLAAETLRLSGASQVFGGVFFPNMAELERSTGIDLEIKSNRSVVGLRELVAGKADLAMISNDLPGLVAAINASEPGLVKIADFVEYQVGATEISFIVNPSNPVSALSHQQVAGLLSGRIDNWREVGGRDEPVLVIAEPSGGIYPDIETVVLKPLGLSWSPTASAMASVVFTTRAVAQAPNAISYMGSLPRAAKDPGVKMLTTDIAIQEPLTLVSLGPASPTARRLIDAATRLARP